MNKFMGRPDLEPTVFTSTKPGLNNIVVKTVHYGNQEMILEKDVPIKMRDGITIRVNVFRPMQPGKYPVVMSMDPYGKDSLPSFAANRSGWPVVGTIDTSEFASDESPDPGFWVPNDYVVVKVAARGSTTSEGDFYPWTRTETEDYYEIIEWAGVQEWSNGNVGLNGVSYLAMTTWRVAALNPPHLKAINPWEGTSDLYREWYFHGGIPETNFSVWFDNTLRMFWPNTRVEDMIGSQKEHPLLDELGAAGGQPGRHHGARLCGGQLVHPGSAQPGHLRGLQENLLGGQMADGPRPQGVGDLLPARGAGAAKDLF